MRIYGALGALACVGICVGPVHAEEAGSVLLPDVMAKGEKVAVPVAMGTGVDSGKSQIDRQDIELRAPGSGDVNELLKILPTVQFSRDQSEASRDAIQDLRPADLSISGGHFYANAFSLDGVSINSRLDVTNDNPQNGSELAGASTQTLWVDAELVGKITVFDSNVSAQYGSFTGGSVQIETRDPRRTLGATASVAHTSDGVTSFKLSRSARAAFANGTELPPTPEFKQWRYGVTVDVPVGDNTAFLVGYNRSESPALAQKFLKEAGRRFYGNEPKLSEANLRRLMDYSWPGNVRELQNVIERAVILSGGGRMQIELPSAPRSLSFGTGAKAQAGIETKLQLRERERRNIEAALAASGGKVSGPGGAAEYLGMKPSTLASRMKAMGITEPRA